MNESKNMADIDPVEFGKMMGYVKATNENTEKILTKFDKELDDHDDRIVDLESHRSAMKKAIKWIGGGVSAVGAFVAWVMS